MAPPLYLTESDGRRAEIGNILEEIEKLKREMAGRAKE